MLSGAGRVSLGTVPEISDSKSLKLEVAGAAVGRTTEAKSKLRSFPQVLEEGGAEQNCLWVSFHSRGLSINLWLTLSRYSVTSHLLVSA